MDEKNQSPLSLLNHQVTTFRLLSLFSLFVVFQSIQCTRAAWYFDPRRRSEYINGGEEGKGSKVISNANCGAGKSLLGGSGSTIIVDTLDNVKFVQVEIGDAVELSTVVVNLLRQEEGVEAAGRGSRLEDVKRLVHLGEGVEALGGAELVLLLSLLDPCLLLHLLLTSLTEAEHELVLLGSVRLNVSGHHVEVLLHERAGSEVQAIVVTCHLLALAQLIQEGVDNMRVVHLNGELLKDISRDDAGLGEGSGIKGLLGIQLHELCFEAEGGQLEAPLLRAERVVHQNNTRRNSLLEVELGIDKLRGEVLAEVGRSVPASCVVVAVDTTKVSHHFELEVCCCQE